MASLAEQLEQMIKDGNCDLLYFLRRSHSPFTIRRRLESEFHEEDIFLNPQDKQMFLPKICSCEKLATNLIELQQKFERLPSTTDFKDQL